MSSKLYRKLGSEQIYKGRIFSVEHATIAAPDGKIMTRDVIRHNGSVAIVPFLDKNHIILIKQYRLPADAYLYEIPAGTIDPGEKPLQCAKRELIEETGHSGKHWEKTAEFFSCPGFCSEKLYLYRATGLTPVKEFHRDEDEDIEVKIFSIREIRKMLAEDAFVDSKTLIGLLDLFVK
ncbi:MAG: NUDIX hydrolase [Planctomycetes bacterium]|nr:NUDIX hydrolase [Planctomycetota bacterium]